MKSRKREDATDKLPVFSRLHACVCLRLLEQVWGKEENLKDLLSDVATGSLQDGQSPGVYLCEDPICGMQVTRTGS